MLSNFEVALNSFSLVLLPLALYSLAHGSPPPKNSWVTSYFEAEKYLNPTGNIMLLALCGANLTTLAMNFGFIPQTSPDFDGLVAMPFMILAIVYLGLWIRAIKKVHRREPKDTNI
ncbi:hypothetical protein [Hyphomicrobium sp. 2TAF46]|uniref:hypothetical protein n=1 Tax=Hyphomicrobium sp. 2TAF46 TaxID=3233019 RepID=UPI003F8D9A2B